MSREDNRMKGVVSKICLCLLLAAAASGCGWWGEDDEQAFEDDLPKLDAAVASDLPAKAETDPAEHKPNEPQLTPGTRVPLRKRVVQTLSQGEVESSTTLDLDFTISIDEILDDGRRRFGVHYDRVRYTGAIAEESFAYDSGNPAEPLPIPLSPFDGLAGNDFYFWIDTKGQIELVGFDRFLRRCVEGLPRNDRETVLSSLAVISDEEGVARFVDETVCLLLSRPERSAAGAVTPKPGDVWTIRRNVGGNVPMQILTEYVVTSVTKTDVEIEMRGIIGPSNPPILQVSNVSGPLVSVRSGKTIGNCTFQRSTGLPSSSHVEQFIDMYVQLENGTRFEQRKHVVTTIDRPSDSTKASPGGSPAISPGEKSAGNNPRR